MKVLPAFQEASKVDKADLRGSDNLLTRLEFLYTVYLQTKSSRTMPNLMNTMDGAAVRSLILSYKPFERWDLFGIEDRRLVSHYSS